MNDGSRDPGRDPSKDGDDPLRSVRLGKLEALPFPFLSTPSARLGLGAALLQRQISWSVAFPWLLKADNTSHRSTASSVYRWKYGRIDNPGADTLFTRAR
jgi:hypothetical protein